MWKSQLSEGVICFIVGKPVDEPSDVAMSLHDSLSRMVCKRKYLIKMMAVKARQAKAGQGRKGEVCFILSLLQL